MVKMEKGVFTFTSQNDFLIYETQPLVSPIQSGKHFFRRNFFEGTLHVNVVKMFPTLKAHEQIVDKLYTCFQISRLEIELIIAICNIYCIPQGVSNPFHRLEYLTAHHKQSTLSRIRLSTLSPL